MAYTKLNTRVDRVQINTTFTPGTITATAVQTEAFLQTKLIVNDSDPTDYVESPWKSIHFDLLDPTLTGVNITAAGKTITYPQLAALIRQAVLDRANV